MLFLASLPNLSAGETSDKKFTFLLLFPLNQIAEKEVQEASWWGSGGTRNFKIPPRLGDKGG